MSPLGRSSWASCLIISSAAIFSSVTGPSAQARSLFVSPLGNGQDGLSWATAYQTIQSAIDSSQPNDDIYVSDDIYSDRVLVTQKVYLNGGVIFGSTGEVLSKINNASRYTTINYSGYPYTAFVCHASCRIRGFRISPTSTTGLSLYRTNITVEDCIIENGAGGIFVNEGTADLKNIIVRNNKVEGSRGGLYIVNGSIVSMENCIVSNNNSYHGGGGGIACVLSSITMDNCIVTNNRAISTASEEPYSEGGGVVIDGNGNYAVLRNCLIANNYATEWKQLVIGSSPEPYVSLDNCTIIGDAAADIHWRNVAPTMMNCILWGATGMLAGEEGEADIYYSCIQGGYTGEGNISDDPLFRDPTNGNYRLLPESPCIDTAATSGPSDDLNGNPRPVDIAGIGRDATDAYDMGAYEFQEWELPVQTGVGNWNLYESQ